MKKGILLFAVLFLLTGCEYFSKKPAPVQLPYTPINPQAEYILNRGDVLELIYQIRDQEQGEYKLRFRDVVAVKFPSTPEMNSVQTIRPDGKISLPYLKDFKVSGMTPQDASESIRKTYDGLLQKPDVFLEVQNFGASLEDLKLAVGSSSRGQSRLVTVRPDGLVTIPILGEMPVSGLSVKQVSARVNAGYRNLYPGVSVDVLLDQLAVTNAYVFGEVVHPGGYRITEPVTPMELLAMAGGGTIDAVLGDAILMHKDRAKSEIVCTKFNLKKMLKFTAGESIPLLEPGDMLFIPRQKISDIAHLTQTLAAIVLFNGQSISYNYRMNKEATNSNGN